MAATAAVVVVVVVLTAAAVVVEGAEEREAEWRGVEKGVLICACVRMRRRSGRQVVHGRRAGGGLGGIELPPPRTVEEAAAGPLVGARAVGVAARPAGVREDRAVDGEDVAAVWGDAFVVYVLLRVVLCLCRLARVCACAMPADRRPLLDQHAACNPLRFRPDRLHPHRHRRRTACCAQSRRHCIATNSTHCAAHQAVKNVTTPPRISRDSRERRSPTQKYRPSCA